MKTTKLALSAVLLLSLLGFDHAPVQAVYDGHVRSGRVDYAAIKAAGSLDGYLEALAGATEPSDRAGKMAFWSNAYNALTIDMIADEWPLGSIMDLEGGKVWDVRKFKVAGREVTLNDIEHKILRPMGDPRIHAAVNCASIGCPPLASTAFTAAGLEGQLQAASKNWVATNGIAIDQAAGTVKLNKIFDWYGDDFLAGNKTDIPGIEGKPEAGIDFCARYLSAEQATWLRAGGYTVGWIDYDWSVNKK